MTDLACVPVTLPAIRCIAFHDSVHIRAPEDTGFSRRPRRVAASGEFPRARPLAIALHPLELSRLTPHDR